MKYNYYLLIEYTEDGQDYFRVLEDELPVLRDYRPEDNERVTLLRRRA